MCTQVLTERGMLQLNRSGVSELIEHEAYVHAVDSHNILAKIPYLGLRVPLKCFRSWLSFARRAKFERSRELLAVGALRVCRR